MPIPALLIDSFIGCARRLLLCGLLALPLAHAQGPDLDASLDTIRRQIDTAQESLKISDKLSDTELQGLRSGALAAQKQSQAIADQLAPQLAAVEARVVELGPPTPGSKEDPDVASQRTLLAKSRNALDGELKLARLLAVEGDQLAAQAWSLRRSQFQARLGERTDSILAAPFWSELRDDLPRDTQRIAALGAELAAAARATPGAVWLGASAAFAAACWALWWLQRRALQWLTTRAPAARLRRSLHALLVVLRWTASFGAASIALDAVLDGERRLGAASSALLAQLAGLLWFGGFLFGLGTALLSAGRPSWRLPAMPDAVAAALRWFPLQLTFVSLASGLAERLAVQINASLAMVVAVNCGVALVMGLTVVLALMRAERVWRR